MMMEFITLYASQALIGAGVLVGIGAIAFLLTKSSNKKNTQNYEKPMLVEKQEFIIPSYKTVSVKEIKDVRIGWEAYGTLNVDKSNVISIISSDNGCVFGGFTMTGWKYRGSNDYGSDKNAFLYQLRSCIGHKPKIYPVDQDSYDNAAHYASSYMS